MSIGAETDDVLLTSNQMIPDVITDIQLLNLPVLRKLYKHVFIEVIEMLLELLGRHIAIRRVGRILVNIR